MGMPLIGAGTTNTTSKSVGSAIPENAVLDRDNKPVLDRQDNFILTRV